VAYGAALALPAPEAHRLTRQRLRTESVERLALLAAVE
jgi:hypothetical protein